MHFIFSRNKTLFFSLYFFFLQKDENYVDSPSHSEGDDEEIRCRCGQNVDRGSLMICCDKCEFWQHAECYYGSIRENIPELFFCHICQPEVK